MGPMPLVLGRYALYGELASGGMATVHVGRLVGPAGFARTVAIKRLRPEFAKLPDIVASEGELFLVMEYVHGDSLSRLLRAARAAGETIPLPIASAIVVGLL